jgi:hypothetical protein
VENARGHGQELMYANIEAERQGLCPQRKLTGSGDKDNFGFWIWDLALKSKILRGKYGRK